MADIDSEDITAEKQKLTDKIKKYWGSSLRIENQSLMSDEVIGLLGADNVYKLIIYVDRHLNEELPLDKVFADGNLQNLGTIIDLVAKERGITFDYKTDFNIPFFQDMVIKTSQNPELVKEMCLPQNRDKDISAALVCYFDSLKYNEIRLHSTDDLYTFVQAEHKDIKDRLESPYITAGQVKDIIFKQLCNMDNEQVKELLAKATDNIKMDNLCTLLGNTPDMQAHKKFVMFLSDTYKSKDLNELKRIAAAVNDSALSEGLGTAGKGENEGEGKGFVRLMNRYFYNYRDKLLGLYGKELKQSLTDIKTLKREWNKDLGVDVINLQGEDFCILAHAPNLFGALGDTSTDIKYYLNPDRATGSTSYTCATLINQDNLENYGGNIVFGYTDIDAKMLAAFGNTDIFSRRSSSMNIDVDWICHWDTAAKTVLKSVENVVNEYDLFIDSPSGKQLKPSCLLCFDDKISDEQIKAANTFKPALPIVKIDREKYQEKLLDKCKQFERLPITSETSASLLEDMLYSRVLYRNQYASHYISDTPHANHCQEFSKKTEEILTSAINALDKYDNNIAIKTNIIGHVCDHLQLPSANSAALGKLNTLRKTLLRKNAPQTVPSDDLKNVVSHIKQGVRNNSGVLQDSSINLLRQERQKTNTALATTVIRANKGISNG